MGIYGVLFQKGDGRMNKLFFMHQVKKLSSVLGTDYGKLSIFDRAILQNYLYIKDSRYAYMKNRVCFCDICFYVSWKYFDIHSIILKKFCKLLSSEYNIELSKLIDMGKNRHDYYDSIDSKASFDELTQIAKRADQNVYELAGVTNQAMVEVEKIRDFKAKGAEGLLTCKIRSIIIPLLADHVLREANHYLKLLKHYREIK
jgi:hypothetical protein